MADQLSCFHEIRSTVGLGRTSIGGAAQHVGGFPGAEPGVSDPHLGEYLSAGKTLERDRSAGLQELQSLASRGSALSMLFVADAMRRGDDHEVDLEASEGWYRRAASLGLGRAMYGLGLIHLARHEIESATEAFETAGERGCGAALWVLGLLHRQGGEGVSPDMDKARAFLKRGSALGHVWSTRSLAVLLMGGRYGLWARLKGYALYAAGFLVVSVAIIRGKSDPVMR